jgi:heme oxygenase
MTILAPAHAPADASLFADHLKVQTQPLHTAAERHPLQADLLKGRLPLATFAALHAQHLLVHRSLERHLDALRVADESFRAIVADHHFRVPLFERDVTDLGIDPASIVPAEATQRFIAFLDRAAADSPIALLGVFYVLEGSTNGAKYIAMAMNRAYSLAGRGISALDPHGESQRERWTAFRAALDAAARTLDESDRAAILDAARATFQYAIDVMDACG